MDDDEESFIGAYEDGHWEWDETYGELVFISQYEESEEESVSRLPAIFGPVEFKDDIDFYEQQKFKKRYQRTVTEDDVVTLQDVKDVVLFTAPKKILSPTVINLLHLPTTERFLRALIFYCQYFLQISDEMSKRVLDLETKVATPKSEEVELGFRENLEDLRLLIAKEYCTIVTGSSEFKRYHHMGTSKKQRSLSRREAVIFESIIRIGIQITWLALGRKWFHKIEEEVHRIFKSHLFNLAEHNVSVFRSKLTSQERFVLLGHCINYDKKINTHSPLLNEINCGRDIDYRMYGLGIIKYHRYPHGLTDNTSISGISLPHILLAQQLGNGRLSTRLRYMERALMAPEMMFRKLEVTLGILGLLRSRFDTMLREISVPVANSASRASVASIRSSASGRLTSRTSRVSSQRKSTMSKLSKPVLYEDIVLPDKDNSECFEDDFPMETHPKEFCNNTQRLKWLSYLTKAAKKNKKS